MAMQGGCRTCGGKSITGLGTYLTVRKAFELKKIYGYPISKVCAVIFQMTHGQGFMGWAHPSFNERCEAVTNLTGVDRLDFLRELQMGQRTADASYCRFRILPQFWSRVCQDGRFKDMELPRKAVLACGLGIAEYPAYVFVEGFFESAAYRMIQRFMRDTPGQIWELACWMRNYEAEYEATFSMVASAYIDFAKKNIITESGERAARYMQELELQLQEKGFPLCLQAS